MSSEISRQFPWRFRRAVSGENFMSALLQASQILGFFVGSEKLQNESSPNFSNFRPEFCPEFCSEFSPNFSRTFRASFCGRRRPEKIHQKYPPFFNAKLPGKHEKIIHKVLLESRQSNFSGLGHFYRFRLQILENLSGQYVG